ncbi:CocE/NonD family hydrolase [Actinomadura rupiterrae]|uniref:CocE/NonD family hydrolase n=1 Tax=Actinomadura rupiterrae TaxID=559627 RepID=UPI0020A5B419|nr:CocE/NonD family hydrolase [Actinomadura rupiterrae]MCP2336386.1 dienelactone hydrolase [Actinomadura rupiterrae]
MSGNGFSGASGMRIGAALALAAVAGGTALAATPASAQPGRAATGYDYREITIPSTGGVKLDGNVFVPRTPGPHPAIVFISSWSLEDHEYVAQAARFAAKGYIVLSYTARGFFNSGGGIDVSGPDDWADGSKAIDWLVAHTDVDRARIGLSGISYGSGISQLVAAHDKRVAAVVAMDTWGDLVQSLYANQTRHMGAYTVLAGSGRLTGRFSPTTDKIINDFGANRNVPALIKWGAVRSPGTYRARLNARKVPVFISNSYGETLFPPNQVLAHFAKLTGPKRLDLSIGDHATAHLTGIFGIPSRTWDDAHRWFDHYLRGADNGIDREPQISAETAWSRKIEPYRDVAAFTGRPEHLTLGAPGLRDGSLSSGTSGPGWTKRLPSGLDSDATGGILIVSGALQTFGLPNAKPMSEISRYAGGVWSTPVFTATKRLRGAPKLELTVRPGAKSATVVAYLYDVDATGTGRLITQEASTLPSAVPGRTYRLPISLQATSFDVPAGHRVALVVDTKDPLYGDADVPFTTTEIRSPSTLDLPVG